jgi:hypothetical protein
VTAYYDGVANDLWSMPLSDAMDPAVIDAFVEARIRESEHLEYRCRIDAGGSHPRNRLAETEAVMANTGGVGLILVGVAEDSKGDRPDKAWQLEPGQLREQTIEALCRDLDPYVPVEIGRSVREAGEVVIIRVPDFRERPVFLRDRGILVRRGQANVPASPSEIRMWLTQPASARPPTSPSFLNNFLDLINKTSPVLVTGVAPGREWPHQRWSDETDDALATLCSQYFPGAGTLSVGESVIRFGREPDGDNPRSFTVSSAGEIIRTSCPDPTAPNGPCNLMAVGIQVAATWAFARAALPVVLPRFPGPATLYLSIGGVPRGFDLALTRETMFLAHDFERSSIGQCDNWRKQWTDIPFGSAPADVADMALSEMLRAFGYRRIGKWRAYVRKALKSMG